MAGSDSETPTKKADEAVQKVRPLTATAARSLTALVENDYAILRAEMKQFHEEKVEEEVRQMRANSSDEDKEVLRKKAERMLVKFRKDLSALHAEASSKSMKLNMATLTNSAQVVTVTNQALEQRIVAFREQREREFKTLMLTVRRQELEAKRRVLIASITSEAEGILASIPTAMTVMAQMYAEKKELASGSANQTP